MKITTLLAVDITQIKSENPGGGAKRHKTQIQRSKVQRKKEYVESKRSVQFAYLSIFLLCAAIIVNREIKAQGNNGNGNGQGKPVVGGPANLPMWSLSGNTISSGNFFGTKNNLPIIVKVNNSQRASFTNSGLELTGNFHSTFASIDSIITGWKLICDNLQVVTIITSSINSQQYLLNGTPLDFPGMLNDIDSLHISAVNQQNGINNIQSEINVHDTAIATVQNQVNTIQSTQWKNDTISLGNIYYDSGKVGIGTSAPAAKLDVYGSQRITGDLYVGGEVLVSDKFSAKTVVSDTAVTAGRLFVNHNLKFGSDSLSTESDIASRQTTLTIQSGTSDSYNVAISADNASRVGIGTKLPTEKLSVDGNVAVTGSVNANTFTALKFSSDTVRVTRVLPADGDSIIHFGLGSISLNQFANRISSSQSPLFITLPKGLSIGNTAPVGWASLFPAHAWAPNSIAIGQYVGNDPAANNSITIGSGDITWSSGQLINTKPNSLMIGFNSTKPTLFISNSNGQNTTGNVGIGTDEPLHKLDVRGHVGLIDHLIFNSTSTHGVINWPESKSLWFRTNATPGDIYSYTTRMIITGDGHIGIGTELPAQALDINGRLNVANGVIQRGGPAIINTSDLGLYSRIADSYIRIVTNNGAIRFYSDDGIGSTANMTIEPNGNVGLGTLCPEEKLAVNGKIRVRYEVFVHEAGDWCDFAFEDNYKRMGPYEKEYYYKTNKHLFAVPSAKEIKSTGLPVVNVLKGLTLNTEENSLDIIELFKRIEALEKENAELKNKLIVIQAKLK